MSIWTLSRRGLFARSALLSMAALPVMADMPKVGARSKNVELILAYCRAGNDRNLEGQMRFIPEHGIYHNMPDAPIVGRIGIRRKSPDMGRPRNCRAALRPPQECGEHVWFRESRKRVYRCV